MSASTDDPALTSNAPMSDGDAEVTRYLRAIFLVLVAGVVVGITAAAAANVQQQNYVSCTTVGLDCSTAWPSAILAVGFALAVIMLGVALLRVVRR
jgi:TRAP-type C4-dicarboxylate transport system permease small subunit